MGAVMYVFAPEMIGMLSPVQEIRELGVAVLRIEAFAEPFFAAAIVSYSVCIGAGDTFKPSLINLGSMWLVRLTLAYALASSYGLRGVWFAMAVELTLPWQHVPCPHLPWQLAEQNRRTGNVGWLSSR